MAVEARIPWKFMAVLDVSVSDDGGFFLMTMKNTANGKTMKEDSSLTEPHAKSSSNHFILTLCTRTMMNCLNCFF